MHPILVTVPGWAFKLFAPGLMLWGLYSLLVAYRRRALVARAARPVGPDTDTDNEAPAPLGDSPGNALLSIAIGAGLFLFSAPVAVSGNNLIDRLASALAVFAHAVASPAVWAARWSSLPVYSYGVMLGLSLVVGWVVTLRLAARQGLPRDLMVDCYVVTAIAAVAGSRVLYVLTNLQEFTDPETHRLSFAAMFALRSGGLVAYGGFLGGLLGSALFLRRHGVSLWAWADAAVPSLASGLAITRIGCYLYGCDFGKPLSPRAPALLRALGTFPHWADNAGSPAWDQHRRLGFATDATSCLDRFHGDFRGGLCFLDPSAPASAPVHPTQLYESLTGLALFAALAWLWRRRRFEGQVFLAFGALYGFARAALEVLRDDHERGFYAGLSTSQLIGLSTGVLCVLLYRYRKDRGARAEPVDLFAKA